MYNLFILDDYFIIKQSLFMFILFIVFMMLRIKNNIFIYCKNVFFKTYILFEIMSV